MIMIMNSRTPACEQGGPGEHMRHLAEAPGLLDTLSLTPGRSSAKVTGSWGGVLCDSLCQFCFFLLSTVKAVLCSFIGVSAFSQRHVSIRFTLLRVAPPRQLLFWDQKKSGNTCWSMAAYCRLIGPNPAFRVLLFFLSAEEKRRGRRCGVDCSHPIPSYP